MSLAYSLRAKLEAAAVPQMTCNALVRYLCEGVPVGGFLEAVISNDLTQAHLRADEHNMAALPALVKFLYNHAPADAVGSAEKYDAWIAKGMDRRSRATRAAPRMSAPLYFYRCKNCLTVAVAVLRAPYGQPWRCNTCRWPMSFLYRRMVDRDEHQKFAAKGIVYNPGCSQENV